VDWGILTLVVATVFAAMGVAIGLYLAKTLASKEEKEDISSIEEDVKLISSRVEEIVASLKEKLASLREDRLQEIKEEISRLEEEVRELRREIMALPISPGSIDALETAEKALKEIDFSLPSVDNSLLTKIKDNLIILRNDVQALTLSLAQQKEREKEREKEKIEEVPPPPPPPAPTIPNLNDLLLSVNTALDLSRKVNVALVKSELMGLAAALKGDYGDELVKILDDQALNSKELVLILEQLRKELEGVGK